MSPAREPTPSEIRSEIETTRERMAGTLEELGDRLNPQRLKQHAKDAIHDATIGRVQDMARNTMDSAANAGQGVAGMVRENPIPVALIAIGAGWLLMNSRRSSASGNGESVASYRTSSGDEMAMESASSEQGVAGKAREKVSAAVGEAQDAMHRVTGSASHAASTVAARTRAQKSQAQDAFESQPLVIGAIAAAVGLAAGLTVPATQKEAELLGDKRDELVDRARDMAREKTEQVRHVAEKVMTDARTSAKEAAQSEGLTI